MTRCVAARGLSGSIAEVAFLISRIGIPSRMVTVAGGSGFPLSGSISGITYTTQ